MKDALRILYSAFFYVIFLILFVIFLNQILYVDKNLFLMINGIQNNFLDYFFQIITYGGSAVFWIVMILLFLIKKEKKTASYLICALLIDFILTVSLKGLFLRPRPSETLSNIKLLRTEISPSFPSGHSSRVFAGATILGHQYPKYKIIFIILAILVAFSRIYIGVHYPLDTLIGSINGILVGLLCLFLPIEKIRKFLHI